MNTRHAGRPILLVALALLVAGLTGCAVARPVIGAGTAVGKAAVKTTGKVAGATVRAAAGAVTPDKEPTPSSEPSP